MDKKQSRENYLLSMLEAKGRVTTEEAVELLNISEATARRMFSNLQKEGKVVRNYGGIQLAGHSANTYSFDLHEKEHQTEKLKIGKLAASFIEDNDTIYLDCGTTIYQMTLALGARISHEEFHSLNIITNSLKNVQAIPQSVACRVILVGGEYNCQRQDFFGPLTEKYVAPFHFTKCFMGADGVNSDMGFSSNQLEISSLNESVMHRSDCTFVLLDSSKYNRMSLVSYAGISDVDAIVTNQAPEGALLESLKRARTKLYITGATNE